MMDYSNRVICGPMVRISSLPFRLLALEYGADIVFSEDLIDYRLTQCVRIENGIEILREFSLIIFFFT
jgi:tRNA-dihydrouridine synthase 2